MEILATFSIQDARLVCKTGHISILKETGIYRIDCFINSFSYYGSGSAKTGLKYRLNKHINELNRGVHHSWILQRDWKRYGESVFTFNILEICSPETCITREQSYIDSHGVGESNNSYNINQIADCALSFARPEQRARLIDLASKEYLVTLPTNEIIKVRNLTAFCEENNLWASGLAFVAKGGMSHSKGYKCEFLTSENAHKIGTIAESLKHRPRCKEYLLIDPDGKTYQTFNLAEFCREHDLKLTRIRSTLSGKQKQHQGWTASYVGVDTSLSGHSSKTAKKISVGNIGKTHSLKTKAKIGKANSTKKFIVISPAGSILTTTNISKFCRENNLSPSSMVAVAKGKSKYHKDWTCLYYTENDLLKAKAGQITLHKRPKPLVKTSSPKINGKFSEESKAKIGTANARRIFNVTTPEGESFEICNLSKFCRDARSKGMNIRHQGMLNVAQGKTKHHKGWNCQYLK